MTRSRAGEPKSSILNDNPSKSGPDTVHERHGIAENLILAPPSNTAARDIEVRPAPPPVSTPYGGPLAPGGRNPSKFLAGPALWFMFATQALTACMVTLYVMIMATAIPSITASFHTISDLDWYSTAYLITLCSIQPLSGKLYTLFSIKPTYLTFITIFETGNLICALARSSAIFIVGRAIAGIGAAGLFSGSIIMQITCVPPHKRPILSSAGMAMTAIGGVVGPVLGGVIAQYLGWRWCYWIFLPLGFVVAVMILLVRIPEQGKPPVKETLRLLSQRLDLLGCFAIFLPACVMTLLGLSWGGQKLSWGSATVIGLLCGGFGLSVVFGFWQRYKQDKALIPPSIFLQPVIFFGCLVSFLQGGAILEMGYYMPLWFQSAKNASPMSSGLMLLPTMISQIVASMVSGYMRTAMLMFMQYFGGAVFLSVAKTIFTNELLSTLHKYAPDVDAYSVVHSGATSAFNGLSEHDRLLVLEAYNKALTSTFWLPTISAVLAFFFSFGIGWKKLPGPTDKAKGSAQSS
ncbi:hypothetical protein NHJ13734_009358 [Beauveria thailandica]